ncbi:MAG: LamG domain-containing protein [Treponema sp.]|jgi:hypothetical protein|nr:LamG domain-containing protein [Treponema sp.]
MKRYWFAITAVFTLFAVAGFSGCPSPVGENPENGNLSEEVESIIEEFEAGWGDLGNLEEDLVLKTLVIGGKTIHVSWESSAPDVITIPGEPAEGSITATVTRPEPGEEDATVTLTATFSRDGETVTHSWTIVVPAWSADALIADYLGKIPILAYENPVIVASFDLPPKGGRFYSVVWAATGSGITLTQPDGETSGKATVSRGKDNDLNAGLTVTFKVKEEDQEETRTFSGITLPKKPEAPGDTNLKANFVFEAAGSDGSVADLTGNYAGSLRNGAVVDVVGTEESTTILALGEENGYFDLGAAAGNILKEATGGFSIATYVYIPLETVIDKTTTSGATQRNNLNFLWNFSSGLSDGTDAVRNGYDFLFYRVWDGQYTTRIKSEERWGARKEGAISQGVWHHVLVTHDSGGVATVYIDGVQAAQGGKEGSGGTGPYLSPSNMEGLVNNWLGRSGYYDGSSIKNASYADFRIYDKVLDASAIEGLGIATALGGLNAGKADDIIAAAEAYVTGQLTEETLGSVSTRLTLPVEYNGVTISWSSSNTAVISGDGTVTRPAYGQNDASVTLTAMFSMTGGTTTTKTYTATVLAKTSSGGLQLHYTFADNNANDQSGNGYNGTLNGSATFGTAGGIGYFDTGSTNGYLDMGASAGGILGSDGEFTIAAYVYIPTSTAIDTTTLAGTDVVNQRNNKNFLWNFSSGLSDGTDAVRNTHDFVFFRVWDGQYTTRKKTSEKWGTRTGSITPAKGLWRHVMVTQDPSGIAKLYINGEKKAENKTGTGGDGYYILPSAMEPLVNNWIGRSGYNPNDYMANTRFADFRIYSEALSSTGIDGLNIAATLETLNSEFAGAFIEAAKAEIDAQFSPTLASVTGDLTLPASAGEVAIGWSSSNTGVITNTGVVTRPESGQSDATVTLTATFSIFGVSGTKDYPATVKALNYAGWIKENIPVLNADSPVAVADFGLPTDTGSAFYSLGWAVQSGDAISLGGADEDGIVTATVTRPAANTGSAATVTLRATFKDTVSSDAVTVDVTVTVPPEPAAVTDGNLKASFVFEAAGTDGAVIDATGNHAGALKGSAAVSAVNGIPVIDLGAEGYFDMGAAAGGVIKGSSNGFSIATYVFIPDSTAIDTSTTTAGANHKNNKSFLWNFSSGLSDGTDTERNKHDFIFYRVCDGQYTVRKRTEEKWASRTGDLNPGKGSWHHILVTQDASGNTALYTDGSNAKTGTGYISPSAMDDLVHNWIGRSGYNPNSYMTNTKYADFRIYDKALDTEAISGLGITNTLATLNNKEEAGK